LSQSLAGKSVVANIEEAIAKVYPKIASMSVTDNSRTPGCNPLRKW
jgi:hypothetical protein